MPRPPTFHPLILSRQNVEILFFYMRENGWSDIFILLHKILKRSNEIQVLCFKDILI